MADQFTRLAKRFDPDLAVMFSNHVASAMHRYWYTAFPEDWDSAIYDDDWVERFGDELPYALRSLDVWLEQWMRWADETNRTIMLISSMGQTGGAAVDTSESETLVVSDPMLFAEALGLEGRYEVGSAMVPQISYTFPTPAAAELAQETISKLSISGRQLPVDRSGPAITFSYAELNGVGEKLKIGDRYRTLAEVGLEVHEVSEHRAGVHDPLGSIVVYNSESVEVPVEPVDYLSIAPAILRFLSVDPLPHHTAPGLVL